MERCRFHVQSLLDMSDNPVVGGYVAEEEISSGPTTPKAKNTNDLLPPIPEMPRMKIPHSVQPQPGTQEPLSQPVVPDQGVFHPVNRPA
jgi:hypothetical protein